MAYSTHTRTTNTHTITMAGGPTMTVVETIDGGVRKVNWSVMWDQALVAQGPAADVDEGKIKADVARRLVEQLRRLAGKSFEDGGYAVDRLLQPLYDRAVVWLSQQRELSYVDDKATAAMVDQA